MRLRPSAIEQLARMICGDSPFTDVFPYRSGSELTGFFTGLGFDHVHSGSRLSFTSQALKQINESSPDDGFGISSEMAKILTELLSPNYFGWKGDHPTALVRANKLILEYGVQIQLNARRGVELFDQTGPDLLSSVPSFPDQGLSGSDPQPRADDRPPSFFVGSESSKVSQHSEALRYDIAIICALSIELRQVSETLSNWSQRESSPDDPSTYHEGTYRTHRGRQLKVIASSAPQMGMPASAVLTTKVILRYHPRLVAMVGIAAGVRAEHQGFGDILAPSITFDYGSGKFEPRNGQIHFSPDHRPLSITPRFLERLRHWKDSRLKLAEISDKWPGVRPRTELNLHIGPMGSGAAVINAPEPTHDILEQWRKLIGIEMEAYGAHLACAQAVEPSTPFLCLKSITDFSIDKDDSWQNYAAFTAAQFLQRFICEEWENLHLDG